MGDRPELARLATDLLAAEVHPAAPAKPAPSVESEIAAMERAIEHSKRRRRMRGGAILAAGGVLAIAAAAAIVLRPHDTTKTKTTTSAPSNTAAVGSDEDEMIVLADGAERIGARILAHEGHATVASKNGTRVAVDAHGDVDLERDHATRKFVLHAGSLDATVAKLAPGERFLVTTADAEVEVRGTAFRVAVAESPTCDSRTSVTVSEGTVWVRFHGEESVVAAGSTWPTCVARLDSPTETRTPAPKTTAPDRSAAVPRITAPAVTALSASVLAEQNRIFEEANAAKKRGDVEAAVAGFERVTQGPLAESAAAERFRVLGKDARARGAARDYLARYPNGFAASEARAIIAP